MNKHKKQQQTAVAEPDYLSPQWYYDTLMEQIEPELMTANVPYLELMYKDDTPEQREERLQRYKDAFVLFGECLQDLEDDAKIECSELKKMMIAAAEGEGNEESKDAIEEIENKIDDSDLHS